MKKSITAFLTCFALTGCASLANGTYKIDFPKAIIRSIDANYSARISIDQRPGIEAPVRISLMLENKGKSPISTNMFTDSVYLTSQTGEQYKIELSQLMGYPYEGATINPGGRHSYYLHVKDKAIHSMIINGGLKTMIWNIGDGSISMDAQYPIKK